MADQSAKTKKIFDGRYEIISIVGRGAKSVVYRAKLISAPYSEVALKVLVDQKGKNSSSERLRREALAMVSCRHRYVARLDDFHSLGSLCYLAMEYAPGSDLRSFIKQYDSRLPIDLAERFFKQAAEGLSFVHRAGIIHRDLKPENILVINDKEIRLTDFGVSLLPGEECSIAELQSGIGTMNYMAPEIIEGRPTDNRADIYALGVVFYELISGANPFQSAPLAKQIEIRKSEKFPRLNEIDPTVPKYISDLIHQCMRYNLDDRFNSCDQLLTSLLNKKSEDFSDRQKAGKSKLQRPKTKNFHKRRKKLLSKTTQPLQESEEIKPEITKSSEDTLSQSDADLFEEFNKIINSQSETEAASENQPVEAVATEEISNEAPIEDIVTEEMDEVLDEDLRSDTPTVFMQSSQSTEKKNIIPVLLKGLFVLLLIFGIGRTLISLVSFGIDKISSVTEKKMELPTFSAEQVSFPNLPSGVYSGSLTGLFSDTDIPLTFVSFEEHNKLAILLGIPGWQPQIVDLPALDQSTVLVIKANGLVLELKGELKSGKISGIYNSLVNGAQGEWSVEPAV